MASKLSLNAVASSPWIGLSLFLWLAAPCGAGTDSGRLLVAPMVSCGAIDSLTVDGVRSSKTGFFQSLAMEQTVVWRNETANVCFVLSERQSRFAGLGPGWKRGAAVSGAVLNGLPVGRKITWLVVFPELWRDEKQAAGKTVRIAGLSDEKTGSPAAFGTSISYDSTKRIQYTVKAFSFNDRVVEDEEWMDRQVFVPGVDLVVLDKPPVSSWNGLDIQILPAEEAVVPRIVCDFTPDILMAASIEPPVTSSVEEIPHYPAPKSAAGPSNLFPAPAAVADGESPVKTAHDPKLLNEPEMENPEISMKIPSDPPDGKDIKNLVMKKDGRETIKSPPVPTRRKEMKAKPPPGVAQEVEIRTRPAGKPREKTHPLDTAPAETKPDGTFLTITRTSPPSQKSNVAGENIKAGKNEMQRGCPHIEQFHPVDVDIELYDDEHEGLKNVGDKAIFTVSIQLKGGAGEKGEIEVDPPGLTCLLATGETVPVKSVRHRYEANVLSVTARSSLAGQEQEQTCLDQTGESAGEDRTQVRLSGPGATANFQCEFPALQAGYFSTRFDIVYSVPERDGGDWTTRTSRLHEITVVGMGGVDSKSP